MASPTQLFNWTKKAGFSYTFDFERNFDVHAQRQFLAQYWTWTLPISVIYVLGVFSGSYFMKNRSAFDLRKPLALWSLSLSIFSLCAMIRLIPELFDILRTSGFGVSVCQRPYESDPRVHFWIWIFCLSKLPELADTAFIVLRKQKLIFLHWYHHFVTLIYAIFGFSGGASVLLWFSAMNVTIHTAMYAYYALKAFRVRVPSFVNVFLTTTQILQMVAGTIVSVYAAIVKFSGHNCEVPSTVIWFGLIVYASYLVLFANFFVQTYLTKSCDRTGDLRTKRQ